MSGKSKHHPQHRRKRAYVFTAAVGFIRERPRQRPHTQWSTFKMLVPVVLIFVLAQMTRASSVNHIVMKLCAQDGFLLYRRGMFFSRITWLSYC